MIPRNLILLAQLEAAPQTVLPWEVHERVIGGFDAHTDTLAGLPQKERDELERLAKWVVDMGQPGGRPVMEITCIGHADRDLQRGAAYEKSMSERRARMIADDLKARISFFERGGFGYVRRPVLAGIKFIVQGVGAAVPHASNRKKPSLTMADRQKNRRVQLLFQQSTQRIPSAPLPGTDELMRFEKWRYPPPEEVKRWWTWPFPKRRDEWRDFVLYLRTGTIFRYVDLKNALEMIVDASRLGPMRGDPHLTEEQRQEVADKWREDFASGWFESRREWEKRVTDPPGDPEDLEEEPEKGNIQYHYQQQGR